MLLYRGTRVTMNKKSVKYGRKIDIMYIAHRNEYTGKEQSIKKHSKNTANYCKEYAIEELKNISYITGLLHDIGKYQPSFVRRIHGENVRIEHSICGAQVLRELYPNNPVSLMIEYCIAGHHSGLPNGGFSDGTADMSTLSGRMARQTEDFSAYKQELEIPELDVQKGVELLLRNCDGQADKFIDQFAFFTRYIYSCLVDADSRDTAEFCSEGPLPRPLHADFEACLRKVNQKLESFVCETTLQKTRAGLQEQVFQRVKEDAEIYLMNMPTGSGKTLCSVKAALERATAKEKKRIIYVIPFNSVIDQTADVFSDLFGEDLEILRHQSTFSYEDREDLDEDSIRAFQCAAENWEAPFIITTAVQFFESLSSNRRGRLRKIHNMADSILIFDEAHLIPEKYLQPCLQSIAYITKYLNSEAIFLTATMPNFSELMQKYVRLDSRMMNLVEDTSLFRVFQKCKYQYLGRVSNEAIVEKGNAYPSSLMIVNTREKARRLFKLCRGRKYHLSTYMTVLDRKRVLNKIRTELKQLEKDFHGLQDVPEDRRITIVSTSLIEAGVDLDVYTVFRETAGLDSILQAGGRCNREGKRDCADVFVFDFEEEQGKAARDGRENLARGLLNKYEDISELKCIQEYYSRLFFMKEDEIEQEAMHRKYQDMYTIGFKEYAENMKIIDSQSIALVVVQDEESQKMVERLRYAKTADPRKLQKYTCSVTPKDLNDLIRQHVVDDFGTGIYCLTNPDYYDPELGVLFEAKDYIL